MNKAVIVADVKRRTAAIMQDGYDVVKGHFSEQTICGKRMNVFRFSGDVEIPDGREIRIVVF